jgi:hypothetical protein
MPFKHRPRAFLLPLLLAFALIPAACGDDNDEQESAATATPAAETATPEPTPDESDPKDLETKPTITSPGGDPPTELVKEDIVKGKGKRAKSGDQVSVQYVGVAYSTGEEFDASWDRGEPFAFQLGAGQVIQGWDAERARDGITKLVGLAQQQGGPRFSPTDVAGARVAFRAEEGALGRPIVVAVGDERAVIALGEEAAEDGLTTPSDRLGEAEIFSKAKEELDGLEPTLIVDGQAAGELIRLAFGNAEDFAEVEPYLRSLEVIASGSEKKGEEIRQRFAIGVK